MNRLASLVKEAKNLAIHRNHANLSAILLPEQKGMAALKADWYETSPPGIDRLALLVGVYNPADQYNLTDVGRRKQIQHEVLTVLP